MGRHVAGEKPELDRLVDGACAEIGREIDALCIKNLAGVVLGGGYGRGEGGAIGNSLSNDLDFFAIACESASEAATAPIAVALQPISEKWTAKLGIDVDFTVKTPWRIRHDQERLMIQELLRGHCDVAGKGGAELFAGVEMIDAAKLPWMEAARLLMNRGIGLVLARESGDAAFAARNVNKCILGAGDARLIARHAYAWRAADRATALGDALYSAAVEWKFRPRGEAVCDWEAARGAWLDALGEVNGASGGQAKRRTLRQAARWIARRRTLGDLRTLGLDPVVRILRGVEQMVRERTAFPGSLREDWKIFN